MSISKPRSGSLNEFNSKILMNKVEMKFRNDLKLIEKLKNYFSKEKLNNLNQEDENRNK
jgi:hypothetical protein